MLKFFLESFPHVGVLKNLLKSLLINIRDDGLSHSLLHPREEHGPEDAGPGGEDGLVDLWAVVEKR